MLVYRPNFYWCCFFTFNHHLLQLRTQWRKERFVSNVTKWSGLVGIWHLTQLLTISHGPENLKLYFLTSFIYTFQFSYIFFPFPNVLPSLPSPTLFQALVSRSFSPVVAQSFGTDGHLSKVVLQQMRDSKLMKPTITHLELEGNRLKFTSGTWDNLNKKLTFGLLHLRNLRLWGKWAHHGLWMLFSLDMWD